MELVYLILVLTLVPNIRKTLKTKENYPEWDKYLLHTRWFAIGLFTVSSVLGYFNDAFAIWIWHAFMILCVYVVYTQDVFSLIRSMMISTVPLIIIGVAESFLKLVFPKFYNEYDNYFATFKFFGFVWIVAIWLQTRKQLKQLETERIKHEEEEELYRKAQERKGELEKLVQERTKEITLQKEELETTLIHLKETQNQLVQSEKMASLGELTAGIAHEIQNPLNFVNNFAEVNTELIDELKGEQVKQSPNRDLIEEILIDLADNMQKMVYHGKRADSIVKGMLMHSRSNNGEKEEVDVNALADEYMRLAYHGLRAKDKSFNATLEKNFKDEHLWVMIIPQDFGRVLLNIFNNAFYAVLDKSRVEGEDYKPTVRLSTRLTAGNLEIRIKDNGTGIPDEVKNRIFEPFFTTKPTGQGTGLGLSLSYDIVTKGHGGSLDVVSKKGEFTEFVVRVPQNPREVNNLNEK